MKNKLIRCKRCNSTLIYLRLKTKEKVCRNCGYIEKLRQKGGKNV